MGNILTLPVELSYTNLSTLIDVLSQIKDDHGDMLVTTWDCFDDAETADIELEIYNAFDNPSVEFEKYRRLSITWNIHR